MPFFLQLRVRPVKDNMFFFSFNNGTIYSHDAIQSIVASFVFIFQWCSYLLWRNSTKTTMMNEWQALVLRSNFPPPSLMKEKKSFNNFFSAYSLSDCQKLQQFRKIWLHMVIVSNRKTCRRYLLPLNILDIPFVSLSIWYFTNNRSFTGHIIFLRTFSTIT